MLALLHACSALIVCRIIASHRSPVPLSCPGAVKQDVGSAGQLCKLGTTFRGQCPAISRATTLHAIRHHVRMYSPSNARKLVMAPKDLCLGPNLSQTSQARSKDNKEEDKSIFTFRFPHSHPCIQLDRIAKELKREMSGVVADTRFSRSSAKQTFSLVFPTPNAPWDRSRSVPKESEKKDRVNRTCV